MPSDFEIGRVVAVDTAQVSVELSKDLRGMSRTTYEGPHEVGRINSYIIIPVGARRLVAMVNRVVLVEEAEIRADRTMVTLPSARRIMKATLIGTIDGTKFQQGISLFPVLDSIAYLPSRQDLDSIFGPIKISKEESFDSKKPGFRVHIGESTVVPGRPIRINPDAFFGKHAAVLGSTGSGKSCTIASILQSIREQPEVKRMTCIILDTNGEYRAAFQRKKDNGKWEEGTGPTRCLYVPSDPRYKEERLAIPYWFMNSEDFVRLFRAREGVQAPVLLRALRLARNDVADPQSPFAAIDVLRTACRQILAHTENDSPNQQWAIGKNIVQCCNDGLRYRKSFPEHVRALEETFGQDLLNQWERALETIRQEAAQSAATSSDQGLGATRLQKMRDEISPVIARLNAEIAGSGDIQGDMTADQPIYFDSTKFIETTLDLAMTQEAESTNPGRIRDACSPMLLRIRRYFEDPRFRFMFDKFPDAPSVLSSFLRDLLGMRGPAMNTLCPVDTLPQGILPFYDRQRQGGGPFDTVVLDMSLLAGEVLENVTALIGRLVLEFLQRLGETGGMGARGSLPVVLVLEEAQNYIRQPRSGEEESIARDVFERIAREGRKYGLSLVVASQRPSELSRTVLSQCSSFVVHRLQNPEDLRYFKEIVPGIYGPMLEQLPALAPQTALVLGECVAAPALVKIRNAEPTPESSDPLFYEYWTAGEASVIDVERICNTWIGKGVD